MEKFASLAPTGAHRGPQVADAASTSTEVRGLPSPDSQGKTAAPATPAPSSPAAAAPPAASAATPGAAAFQLARNDGAFELRPAAAATPLDAGYEEVGRFGTVDEALAHVPEDRFVVFENSETGAVEMRRQADLAHAFSGEDGFDRIRIFGAQADAEAYASRRSA